MTWTLLIDPISRIIDKIIPDKAAAEKAKLELLKEDNQLALEQLKLALEADKSQNAINQEEAKHANIFISGWRPFVGWVCGVAFAYHFVFQPLLAFALANSGHQVVLPTFDMDALFTVLMGMLGLGGMRTFERIRGVARR